jgi:hypothetical protein
MIRYRLFLVLAQLGTFSAPHQIRQLSKVQETRYRVKIGSDETLCRS